MTRHLPTHMPADGHPGDLTRDDQQALARSWLFKGCTPEQLGLAQAFAFARHLPHGAFLLQPGEPNGHLYVLAEGQLGAFRDAALQAPLARFVPADCVGEHALVGHDGGTAYVAAQWPSRLLALDAGQMRALMETAPRIALNVLDMLSARLRAANLRPESGQPHESLAFMAAHDAVTGLYNRRWMVDAYAIRIRQAAIGGEPLWLAFVDVDHFDKLNRALGRAAGDAILRQLADLIRNALPAQDSLARMGGDRFAVLMKGSMAEVVASFDRLRSQIAGRQFVLRGTLATQITVSIGVAQAATDLDDALEKASRCLARAKERGPNVVESLPG